MVFQVLMKVGFWHGNVAAILNIKFEVCFSDQYHEHKLKLLSVMNAPEFTDGKSTTILVMAWCHQAPSHYLNQCWPCFMTSLGTSDLDVKEKCLIDEKNLFVEQFCSQVASYIVFMPYSLWPHDATWKHRSSSTLNQIMAWHLLSPKPLPESMLPYYPLGSNEQILMEFYLKFKRFYSRKCISKRP